MHGFWQVLAGGSWALFHVVFLVIVLNCPLVSKSAFWLLNNLAFLEYYGADILYGVLTFDCTPRRFQGYKKSYIGVGCLD